jgi:hypothetical protein
MSGVSLSSLFVYVASGISALAITFLIVLYVLLQWSPPTPPISTSCGETTATAASRAVTSNASALQATPVQQLPKLPETGIDWVGDDGVNFQVVDEASAVKGQPALRIIAIPSNGVHTIAPRFTSLIKGHVYRIAAWVKPLAGANFEMVATDLAANSPNVSAGSFDLARRKVMSASGAVKAGIDQGPQDWQNVWVDARTETGQFVVNFYVLKCGESTFAGDGSLGIVLGGVLATRQR